MTAGNAPAVDAEQVHTISSIPRELALPVEVYDGILAYSVQKQLSLPSISNDPHHGSDESWAAAAVHDAHRPHGFDGHSASRTLSAGNARPFNRLIPCSPLAN